MRVLVTGASGFLGRHVCRALEEAGHETDVALFDLRGGFWPRHGSIDGSDRPEAVVHLAATVGGIGANQAIPANMIEDNLLMAVTVARACVEREIPLVAVGSVCAYPKWCPIPFRESDLFNGYPEETNAPYGIAKRALLELCRAYRRQYGLQYTYLIPANLYGPGDHFEGDGTHVIPAMIAKMCSGEDPVTLWGDGSPTREFLYVEDAARAIVAAVGQDIPEPINIGTGREVGIGMLAEMVAVACGYGGEIRWDNSRPNGQPRRRLDVSRARELLGWEAQTDLMDGLVKTAEWYKCQRR